MSFSSNAKNEIAAQKIHTAAAELSELMAIVAFGGKIRRSENGYILGIITENAKIARHIYKLMRSAASAESKIRIRKTAKNNVYYQVYTDGDDTITAMMRLGFISKPAEINYFNTFCVNTNYLDKPFKCKAFLKGAFLSCGTIMNPEKNYHMEFAVPEYSLHNDLYRIMMQLNLKPKVVVRKGDMVIYFKHSSEIADILTLMGAFNALMDFHNAKILKEIRNNVNRTVNCESANVQKTVDASVEQVKAIEKLMRTGAFDTLPDNLKEIARLRMEYREHSLKELGEMLNPPLGKSGVNHRLRKIQEEADKYQ